MGCYIDQNGNYYEGDRVHWRDRDVPRRPSPLHAWSGTEWIADINALRASVSCALPTWEAAERAAGIDHAGRRWRTTPAALQDIRDALLAGMVPGGLWRDDTGATVPMTVDALRALWGACITRGAQIDASRHEMEVAIGTMTRAELEAFAPGWPVQAGQA